MEAMSLLIRAPFSRPFPPSSTTNHRKPNAVAGGPSSPTSKWANRLFADFQFLPTTDSLNHNLNPTLTPPYPPPLSTTTDDHRHVSMPIDFYKVLGAKPHFVGDGINRCYEARVSNLPQFGYSDDALVSRRMILQAACETLANPRLRREYDEEVAEDEFNTVLTDVPWDNVIL